MFITLEGCEGVGKSTALSFIANYLSKQNIDTVLTREPGGTDIGEGVRNILLTKTLEMMTPETELLLLFAARAQHIAQVVRPALKKGQWVVSDRFTDASFAYQGGGRGVSMTFIQQLADHVQADTKPDLTILLDAPVVVGLSRLQQRGKKDRIEQEDIAFFERVRNAYLQRAQAEPGRFAIVNADQSVDSVQSDITKILKRLA